MTEQRIKSFPVSWEELHRTSKALAWRLLELGPFNGLIAVTRGGLVPLIPPAFHPMQAMNVASLMF